MSQIRKIVLTGGPCAGKTTLTQVIERVFHEDVVVVPEAASLLFSGGFPRWREPEARRAVQRAIYHVQCELEAAFSARYPDKVLILDRGTVDGAAYWTEGTQDYFRSLGTTLTRELTRYDRVLYLESAAEADYLAHVKNNPNRTETWEEAQRLDRQTQQLWAKHPHMSLVRNERSFGLKISEVLGLVEKAIRSGSELPVPAIVGSDSGNSD
ncbi:MAG: ATP-binding protein [Oligoflexia bacterium]|nr:ATP-binding protein [Oligoflexia bacterium]